MKTIKLFPIFVTFGFNVAESNDPGKFITIFADAPAANDGTFIASCLKNLLIFDKLTLEASTNYINKTLLKYICIIGYSDEHFDTFYRYGTKSSLYTEIS